MREVEQQPVVLLEDAAALDVLALDRELPADVVGRRLPPVVVDRAAAEHLEVLRRAGRGRRWPRERGEQRSPSIGMLLDTVDGGRRFDAGRVEDRRHEVDRVAELVAHLAARGDARGPVHDQRRAHATEPRVALPQAQRRVAGPRPAPGVVVVRAVAAEVVDAREVLVEVFVETVHEAVFVDRSVRTALGARPVVGDEADQRVVEQVVGAQVLDHASDLVIGVREEAGVHLHHARVEALLLRGQARPTPRPTTGAGSAGVGRDDAVRDLPREHARRATHPSRRRTSRRTARSTPARPDAARASRRSRTRGRTACPAWPAAGPATSGSPGRRGPR